MVNRTDFHGTPDRSSVSPPEAGRDVYELSSEPLGPLAAPAAAAVAAETGALTPTAMSVQIKTTIETLLALKTATEGAIAAAKKLPAVIVGLGAVAEGVDNAMSMNPIRWAYGLSQVAAGTVQLYNTIRWDQAGVSVTEFSRNIQAGCEVIGRISEASGKVIEQCQRALADARNKNSQLDTLTRQLDGLLGSADEEGRAQLNVAKILIDRALIQSQKTIDYLQREQQDENSFKEKLSDVVVRLRRFDQEERLPAELTGDVLKNRFEELQKTLRESAETLEGYSTELTNRQIRRDAVFIEVQSMTGTLSDATRQVVDMVTALQGSMRRAQILVGEQRQVIETQGSSLEDARKKLHMAACLNKFQQMMASLIQKEASQPTGSGITGVHVGALGVAAVAGAVGTGVGAAVAAGAVWTWYFNREASLLPFRERVEYREGEQRVSVDWGYDKSSHGTARLSDVALGRKEATPSTTQGTLRIRVLNECLNLPFDFSRVTMLPLHTLNDLSNFLSEKVRLRELDINDFRNIVLAIQNHRKERGVPGIKNIPLVGPPLSRLIKPDVTDVLPDEHMVMLSGVLLAFHELSEDQLRRVMPSRLIESPDPELRGWDLMPDLPDAALP